jgi:hypothetical protein
MDDHMAVDNREALERAWRILDDVRLEEGLATLLGGARGITVALPQDPHDCAAVILMMAHIARAAMSGAHQLCLECDPPIDVSLDSLIDSVREASYAQLRPSDEAPGA